MSAKSYTSPLAARLLPLGSAQILCMDWGLIRAGAVPAAAPNSFSVNRISVLFNWQNFNSCKFFPVFLMKTGAAKFWICISIDYYSIRRIAKSTQKLSVELQILRGDCQINWQMPRGLRRVSRNNSPLESTLPVAECAPILARPSQWAEIL